MTTAISDTYPTPTFDVLPHSPDAESYVVACMTLYETVIPEVVGLLGADDFYSPRNRLIFETLCRMHDQDTPIDLVSLKIQMEHEQTLDRIGGAQPLIDMVEGGACPTKAYISYYAGLVKEDSSLRRLYASLDQARREILGRQTNPQAVSDSIAGALEDLHSRAKIKPRRIRGPNPMAAAQLAATYPNLRDPVIDGLLRRGEVLNLISGSKANKSWLLMSLAFAIATGQPWMEFPTRQGRVLMLDYELSPGTLASRLQAVGDAMGSPLAEIGESIMIEALRGRRLDIGGLGRYMAAITEGQYDVIMIDPLYRLFEDGTDENDNAAIANLYATLQAHAETTNSAIIIVHHANKGNQADKAITDMGSGAGAQSRAADAHLALRPHSEPDAAVMGGVLRSFRPFEPFCLRWQYPLWRLAPDLDPADLKRYGPTIKRREEPAEPAAPTWDVPSFVKCFITPEPVRRDKILDRAIDGGVSDRLARKLIDRGLESGQVYRWVLPPTAHTIWLANAPQPKLDVSK